MLDRMNVREYDQVVSLYTKEKGRLDVLARGVKKITSKNSSNAEPGSCIIAEIVQGKEWSHLIKVQPVDSFRGVRSDFYKSLAVQYAISFLKKVTHVGQCDEKLFSLLLSFLYFLDTNEISKYATLLDAYVVNSLGGLGVAPQLSACVVCGMQAREIVKHELADAQNMSGLYFMGGGIVCGDCALKKRNVGERVDDLGTVKLYNIQRILDVEWRMVELLDIPGNELGDVHNLVYEYACYHIEKKLINWEAWFDKGVRRVDKSIA